MEDSDIDGFAQLGIMLVMLHVCKARRLVDAILRAKFIPDQFGGTACRLFGWAMRWTSTWGRA